MTQKTSQSLHKKYIIVINMLKKHKFLNQYVVNWNVNISLVVKIIYDKF